VGHHTEAFVGIDTSKLRNAVAIGRKLPEISYLAATAPIGRQRSESWWQSLLRNAVI
jgi:hypothetical protein